MRARASLPHGPRATFVFALAFCLALGTAWIGLESLLMALSGSTWGRLEVVRRALVLLPWQLGVFAIVGLALYPIAATRSWTRTDLGWAALGGASFVFLAARVAEGLVRQNSPRWAALAVVLVALALAAALLVVRSAGGLLPAALRARWHYGAWTAWTLIFLCYLRRAGPALGNGKVGLDDWLRFVDAREIGLALAAGAAVLLLSSSLGRALGAAACVGALVLAPHGASRAQEGAPGARPPDVILIVIDTFRFDHLGVNVDRRGLTPNLDALAGESIRFARAFSPSNVTSLAMPGVLASLPPFVSERRIAEEAVPFAEALQQAGYRTIGVSTNPNVSAQFGYQQGFDHFLDPTDQPDFLIGSFLTLVGSMLPGPAYGMGVIDASLFYRPFEEVRRRGLRLLDASPGPTFLYLHTMDPHGPYLPPKRYLPPGFSLRQFFPYHRFTEMSGRNVLNSDAFAPHLENLRQRYEGEVRHTDHELGRLVEELRERGRWDESIVWLTSDHGEAFGEGDFAGHGGQNVTTTLIQTPLLLKVPRSWGVEPRVERTPVSTLDLLPTTLSMLGREGTPHAFGEDLRALVRGEGSRATGTVISYTADYLHDQEAVLQTYSAIDWPWKLDVRLAGDELLARRLFDLEADPDEKHDLSSREPEVVARLERELGRWRVKEREYLFDNLDPSVDEKVLEQLRKLGYVN